MSYCCYLRSGDVFERQRTRPSLMNRRHVTSALYHRDALIQLSIRAGLLGELLMIRSWTKGGLTTGEAGSWAAMRERRMAEPGAIEQSRVATQ